MNHLEQLVSEWLQYNGYFVRTAVSVGARPRGGYDGELDVVALHPGRGHFLHVECSLDGLSWAQREERFLRKFECGRTHAAQIFDGFTVPETPDQAAVLQFAARDRTELAGVRLVTGFALVQEILAGLKHTSPASGAVPPTWPLLRTLQLAACTPRAPIGAASLLGVSVKP